MKSYLERRGSENGGLWEWKGRSDGEVFKPSKIPKLITPYSLGNLNGILPETKYNEEEEGKVEDIFHKVT